MSACSPAPEASTSGRTTTVVLTETKPGASQPVALQEVFGGRVLDDGLCGDNPAKGPEAFACWQVWNNGHHLLTATDPVRLSIGANKNHNYGNFGLVSLRYFRPECIAAARIWGVRFRVRVTVAESPATEAALRCEPEKQCTVFRFVVRDAEDADHIDGTKVEPWLWEVPLRDVLRRPGGELEQTVSLASLVFPEWNDGRVNDREFRADRLARLEFAIALGRPDDTLDATLQLVDFNWVFREGADVRRGPRCSAEEVRR